MATKYIILRSGTEWQIPTDYDSSSPMTFHCIGAGGGGGKTASGTTSTGGGGGGGGAYSSSAITVIPGARLYYSIGSAGAGATANNTSGGAGGDTWINWNTSTNTSSNTPPNSNATGVLAKGGAGGGGAGGGGAGGASASGFGTTKYSGGNGGTASSFGGGGGGAVARQNANGGSGGTTTNYGGAGGGGYGNGTNATSTTGTAGGTNINSATAAGGALNTGGTAGTLGGGGGGGGGSLNTSSSGVGGAGGGNTSFWSTISGLTGFSGGGGGGGGTLSAGALASGGGNAAFPGSGGGGGGGCYNLNTNSGSGGAGGAGTIIVQYEVKPKLKTVILTSGSSWTVPSDWTDAGSSIIAIGGGGGGGRAAYGSGAGGGGGAMSAISGTDLTGGLTPGANVYYSIGASGSGATANNSSGATGGDTWFNKNSASVPSATTAGVLAKGGNGGTGGTGGAGGSGGSATSCIGIVRKSGGNGGAGLGVHSAGVGGGGGGSAASIIANGFNGSNGALPIYTNYYGGNGGGVSSEGITQLAGAGGGGGGGFNGLKESGGGIGGFGGTIINNNADPGGNGVEFGTAGSGGGGSGAGGAVAGGAGGNYGGGGGGGYGFFTATYAGGNGAPGAIIIQYISYSLPTTDGSPISLFDIQRVFGGSNPISISEYYAGGTYVPAGTTGTYGAVPTSGAISLRNFYGTGITVIPYFGQSANDTVWGVYADPILLTANKTSGDFSIEYFEESFTTVKHNFNANGTFAWGKTAGNLHPQGNHIDSSGNYYTVGWYYSTNVRAYIAKFNSSGTLTYHREYTGGGGLKDVYTGVSTGPSGNTYVCGYYDITSGGAVYPMITKYNPSGTILYQRGRQLGTLGNLYLDGKVNSSETAYVAVGYYRTTASRTNPLIEYWTGIGTSTPTISWAKYSITAVNSFSRFISVEIDSGGNVIAVGSIDGTAYVAKFDSSGTLLWHKKVTGISSDVTTVQVDSSDNIYVGTYSVYFKLNSSGTFIESMSFNNNDVGYTQGFPKMSVVGSNVIFPLSTYQTGTTYSPAYGVSLEMFRVPNDSSKTGNYGIYSLVRSTSFPTFTNATNGQTTLATTVTNLSRTSGSSPTVTWNNTASLTPYNYVEFP